MTTTPAPSLLLTLPLAGVALPAAAAAPQPGASTRILVDGGTVLVMDDAGTVLEGGAVLVEDGRIAGLLDRAAPRPPQIEVLDATGTLVIPGLVNTHGHAAMTLLRGLADDLPLMTWLEEHIFPAEAALVAPDFVYWGTLLASIEMLKSGTTTFADMYFFRDEVVRATEKAGIRAVTGPSVIGFPAPDFASPAAALAGADEFFEAHREHPLLIPGTSAHALYTTSIEDTRAAFEAAERHGAPFQIHAAEANDEDERVRAITGMGVIEALDSIGALRPGTILAHGIYLSEDDIAIVAASGAGVAHNPESNMKLGSDRAAPVTELLAAGVPVGLGTDGAASNNDLDMFGEMDTAAKLHKFAHGDPTRLPAETVFRMATVHGARALNLADRIGSLEVGKRADIVLVETRRAGLVPLYRPYSHLVYAVRGSDVRTVLVDGRVVVRDGRMTTVDEAAVMAEARKFRARAIEATSGR